MFTAADGYILAGDATKLPDYATFKKTGWDANWNGATDDVRALQKADKDERIAGQWGTNDPSYDLEVNLTDDALHQVAIYGLDWDRNGRALTIHVLDAQSEKVLDTRALDSYVSGKYLLWKSARSCHFSRCECERLDESRTERRVFRCAARKVAVIVKVECRKVRCKYLQWTFALLGIRKLCCKYLQHSFTSTN